jgi:hypothetical protein
MRAHTITTISRGRRSVRRRRVIALALGVCALAIPATANALPIDSGYSSANAITGGASDSSPPIDGWNYSIIDPPMNAANPPTGSGEPPYGGPEFATANATLGADGLGEPTLVTGSPAGTSDGFDWVSALVGAGAAMALAALGGAALLTVRRRTPVPPPAPTS